MNPDEDPDEHQHSDEEHKQHSDVHPGNATTF